MGYFGKITKTRTQNMVIVSDVLVMFAFHVNYEIVVSKVFMQLDTLFTSIAV